MCELNVYDVCEIQESLGAYRKLLEWLPAVGEEEEAMRESRIKYVEYLIEKCEKVIQGEKIWSLNNEQSNNWYRHIPI